MKIYCNPLNFGYKYQFNKQNDGSVVASREAADPSLIRFQGKYLLFPSMTAGFLYSEDLAHWEFQPTEHLPIYDYAPDVRAAGEYLYFCASSHEEGVFYRTRDPFGDEYERIEGAFPFWDPDLFVDEDGKFYFYWGSSTTEPLYGIELDPATMQPVGEKVALCAIDTGRKGYERNGENHVPSRSKEEMERILEGLNQKNMPESMKEAARNYIMERPYMEGAWVNKHNGAYYLQYGTPSSARNIYGDGVYVSDRPLGPYVLAKNNPYSYKPGGFLPGAGHGSTMEDADGSVWHISTMRICKNHNFERRIGLWPAGYDADGELSATSATATGPWIWKNCGEIPGQTRTGCFCPTARRQQLPPRRKRKSLQMRRPRLWERSESMRFPMIRKTSVTRMYRPGGRPIPKKHRKVPSGFRWIWERSAMFTLYSSILPMTICDPNCLRNSASETR